MTTQSLHMQAGDLGILLLEIETLARMAQEHITGEGVTLFSTVERVAKEGRNMAGDLEVTLRSMGGAHHAA